MSMMITQASSSAKWIEELTAGINFQEVSKWILTPEKLSKKIIRIFEHKVRMCPEGIRKHSIPADSGSPNTSSSTVKFIKLEFSSSGFWIIKVTGTRKIIGVSSLLLSFPVLASSTSFLVTTQIIDSPFLIVHKNLISFGHLLELPRGLLLVGGVLVWMPFPRQFLVSLLDVLGGGRLRDPQHAVAIHGLTDPLYIL